MSLYSRKKKNEQFDLEKSFGSYSGMFANLCKVFLLLYVVVTLQNITMSVSTAVQAQKLAQNYKDDVQKIVNGYEKQLEAYHVEKEKYLKDHATQAEADVYKDAMRKLASLEDDKKEEVEQKVQALKETQEKLNEVTSYKAMIKNIIDSKVVVQAKLAETERIKAEAERKKQEADQALANLKKSYDDDLQREVEQEELKFKRTYSLKLSVMENEIALKKKELDHEKKKLSREQVAVMQAKLQELEKDRRKLKHEYAAKTSEREQELAEEYQEYKKEVRQKFNSKLEKQKGQLTGQLEKVKGKLTGQLAREKNKYEGELAGVKQHLAKTKSALSSVKEENKRYLASVEDLEGTNEELKGANENLKGDVETLRALKTRREKLIGEIASAVKGAFDKNGVQAETNFESGEVVIFFKDTYFDYGSAVLKEKMKQVLNKALPVYANTVFGDKKYSNKIGWVEIVGFASPTYRGKFVNPSSMSGDARRALNYNMDLSYRRAKSIFEFIFDPAQMKFPFQKSMVLLTKVAGRSYLASQPGAKDSKKLAKAEPKAEVAEDGDGEEGGRAPASADDATPGQASSDSAADAAVESAKPKSFCEKFNCAAEQRVAIRFHLLDSVPAGGTK